MTEDKKERWLNHNILGMGLADFFSDTNHEMATSIVPIFLATTLGAPAFALGLIEGVSDGIAMLFMVFAGWYSDKVGKRKGIAVVGYGILAVGMSAMAWASSWSQVLAARTLGWIGWASRSPVRDALLLESAEPETVGRVFAFHGIMDTLGAIAGPLIATLLLAHISIRDIFLIAFIPGLCAFLSVIFDEHGSAYGMLNFTQGVGDFFSSVGVGALWTFVSPVIGFGLAGILAIISAIVLYAIVPKVGKS